MTKLMIPGQQINHERRTSHPFESNYGIKHNAKTQKVAPDESIYFVSCSCKKIGTLFTLIILML